MNAGETPGTLLRFAGRALDGPPGKATVHRLGFADLMVAMKLLGEAPEEVVLVGIEPVTTEWGAQLTPPVQETLPALLAVVLEQLQLWEKNGSPAGFANGGTG